MDETDGIRRFIRMTKHFSFWVMTTLAGLGVAGSAAAQLLPGVPQLPGMLPSVIEPVTDSVRSVPDSVARTLEAARIDRVAALMRDHPREIAIDPAGFPARAGEVVIDDPDDRLIAAATANGFVLIERGDALGIGFARMRAPKGVSLKAAIRDVGRLGAKGVTADQLHFQSGSASAGPPAASGNGAAIGIIDGGVASGAAEQRGFAIGAPRASNHGSAVASLILGQGSVRGAVPGAKLYAADVYGSDPAGGNATAIAKALAWLTVARVPVVTISLVGPANPLLARVIAAAQARGVIIVAAVGNDGPASPLSYPASYPGVIAVTGADARGRVLIEAGRASHLDYAAPGADMLASSAGGALSPYGGRPLRRRWLPALSLPPTGHPIRRRSARRWLR